MLKIIFLILVSSAVVFANSDFSILYKIQKGEKKLGYYEVNFAQNSISSNSYGAANKLEMFSTKNIIFVKDGFKTIEFTKNNKTENFKIYTLLSALDEGVQKEYERKFKKVKDDSMLFITKNSKKRIELFNKRKVTIKTLDELLSDIYFQKLSYDKFILFDKLGVMKMVAKVEKTATEIIIHNASKDKKYMKIVLKDGLPVSIESLVSNWSATLVKSGVFKEYSVDLSKMVSQSYLANLSDELQGASVDFSKIKKTKSFYQLRGEFEFTLPANMLDEKSYKQKEYCKKLFKKSKIKHKKISVEEGVCVANITIKVKIKKLKKAILKELVKKHKQLKITKKVKFNKDSITYEVL